MVQVQAPLYSHHIPEMDDANDEHLLTSWLQVIHNVYGDNADLYVDVLGMLPYPPGYMYSLGDIQMAYFDRRSELFQILAHQDEHFGGNELIDEQHLSQQMYTEQCMDAVVMAFRILSQPQMRYNYDLAMRKKQNIAAAPILHQNRDLVRHHHQSGGMYKYNKEIYTDDTDNHSNDNQALYNSNVPHNVAHNSTVLHDNNINNHHRAHSHDTEDNASNSIISYNDSVIYRKDVIHNIVVDEHAINNHRHEPHVHSRHYEHRRDVLQEVDSPSRSALTTVGESTMFTAGTSTVTPSSWDSVLDETDDDEVVGRELRREAQSPSTELSTPPRRAFKSATKSSPPSTLALQSSPPPSRSPPKQRKRNPSSPIKEKPKSSPKSSPSKWLLSRFGRSDPDADGPPMARFRPSLLSRITTRSSSPGRKSRRNERDSSRSLSPPPERRRQNPTTSPPQVRGETTRRIKQEEKRSKQQAKRVKPGEKPTKQIEKQRKQDSRGSRKSSLSPSSREEETVKTTEYRNRGRGRGRTHRRQEEEEDEEEDEVDEGEDEDEEEEEEAPKGIVDSVLSSITKSTIYLEITGAFYDTAVSVDQVINAFTLQERDIDAVMGRIDKAKRLLTTNQPVSTFSVSSVPGAVKTSRRRSRQV